MSVQSFSAILLNLDRDTQRLAHMQYQLAQAGIAYTRQAGILGDAVPEGLRDYFYTSSGHPKTIMKRGEIGCYASHLRALMRVASGDLGDAVLIMEDDLTIAADFIDSVNNAQKLTPSGWDTIRLSSPTRRAYAPIADVGHGRFLVRYSKIPNSAGAYLVTPLGAKKFLRDGVRGLTFDDDLRRPWFHHMDSYGIIPPPAAAGALPSSIDKVEAGRFDKGMSSRRERIQRKDYLHTFKRLGYNIKSLGVGGWLLCSAINIIDMSMKPFLGRSIIHTAARLFPVRQKNAR